ncbi:MAG: hypothetical protein IPL39_18810 [Opitutaceae bacterium]|nr:hypothetical protein [Opitutaceae bacterium]
MRWIFENPQLLLLIAGAVAYWLNERRKLKETKQEMEQELAREPGDDEMAERTRRIQEEIRRKIEERQGTARPPDLPGTVRRTPPPMPAAPPALAPAAPVVVIAEAGTGAAELERVMEQQRHYAEQLRALESLSRTAPTPVNVAAVSAFAAEPAVPASSGRALGLLEGLRDRDGLRRAIVLREILGPAKALQ